MSIYDSLFDGVTAIKLLQRINKGDETAFKEIEPLLARIDKRDTERRAAEVKKQERKNKGRKNSGKFEIAARIENGTDHGIYGLVLIRSKAARLIWRGGSNYFGGIGITAYAPAELEIQFPITNQNRMPVCLTGNHRAKLQGEPLNGVRLSKALVLRYTEQIDKVFGAGAAGKAAQLKTTVML